MKSIERLDGDAINFMKELRADYETIKEKAKKAKIIKG